MKETAKISLKRYMRFHELERNIRLDKVSVLTSSGFITYYTKDEVIKDLGGKLESVRYNLKRERDLAVQGLQIEIERISKMDYFEFRKWKKSKRETQ